jgi:dihydroneopterin aldolase
VAQRIIQRVFKEVTTISSVKLGVSKLNPPIGGDVEAVTIEMEESRK